MVHKSLKKICLVMQEKEVIEEEKIVNKLDENFYNPIWTNEEKAAFAPIDRMQENKDVIIFQKNGDMDVFQRIYENRIPTLKVWARKYYYLADSADDMFGELSFYFAKAAMKYDKNRGSFNTCLYTFFQNCIRNIRNGKKAKKRKPIGSDPNTITNYMLSLDYDYSTKDGNESTLKDLLANEMGKDGDVVDNMHLEETLNILSNNDPSVKGFLRRLGNGSTLSSLVKELRSKTGHIKISRHQAKTINKKRKYKRFVSDIIKTKTDIKKFVLLDYKVTKANTLSYVVELPKTQEADLVMKTIRNLRRDRSRFLTLINR